MTGQYRQITVDRQGDVFCVGLRKQQMDETELYELSGDLLRLISEENCRKLALSLGPKEPRCLYSIFLAKLITVRRRLLENGGTLVLCDASPAVREVFEACRLLDYFDFAPDMPSAVARLGT